MMLKISLCIALVLATTSARIVRDRDHLEDNDQEGVVPNRIDVQNVTHMIKSQGYPVEEYTVTTSDGYILDLIRIPHGVKESPYKNIKPIDKSHTTLTSLKNGDNQEYLEDSNVDENGGKKHKKHQDEESWEQSADDDHSQNPSANDDENDDVQGSVPITPVKRLPVLLVTDFVANAEDFVIDGSTKGLAFILADVGFDVYLGNVRGSRYGLKHTILNGQQDSAFWRFGIYDIGTKDLPAIVDKVIEISRVPRIRFVGHMHGATAFYIMASEKPHYNNKISSMVSLGPVAYLKDSTNKVLKEVSEHLDHSGWIIKHMGQNKFTPSQQLMHASHSQCVEIHNDELVAMCRSNFFLLSGYNSHQINETSMRKLIWRVPSATSTKQVLELAFMVKTGTFGKCELIGHDECKVHAYDLNKVTAPVSFITSRKDSMSSVRDTEKLVRQIGNPKYLDKTGYDNNLDLLHGKNVDYVVAPSLIKMLISA